MSWFRPKRTTAPDGPTSPPEDTNAAPFEYVRGQLDEAKKCLARSPEDVLLLAQNPAPPDLAAFAEWCLAKQVIGFASFPLLWQAYLNFCIEQKRRALSPGQLQRRWLQIGERRRAARAQGPRPTIYIIRLVQPPAASVQEAGDE